MDGIGGVGPDHALLGDGSFAVSAVTTTGQPTGTASTKTATVRRSTSRSTTRRAGRSSRSMPRRTPRPARRSPRRTRSSAHSTTRRLSVSGLQVHRARPRAFRETSRAPSASRRRSAFRTLQEFSDAISPQYKQAGGTVIGTSAVRGVGRRRGGSTYAHGESPRAERRSLSESVSSSSSRGQQRNRHHRRGRRRRGQRAHRLDPGERAPHLTHVGRAPCVCDAAARSRPDSGERRWSTRRQDRDRGRIARRRRGCSSSLAGDRLPAGANAAGG